MRFWLRMQMGQSLAGQAISIILLSANLSPAVGKFFNCRALYFAALLPPAIALLLLAIGTIMDRAKWQQRMDRQNLARSVAWPEAFERLQRIEASIDHLIEREDKKNE